jgi:hypothetical protein
MSTEDNSQFFLQGTVQWSLPNILQGERVDTIVKMLVLVYFTFQSIWIILAGNHFLSKIIMSVESMQMIF